MDILLTMIPTDKLFAFAPYTLYASLALTLVYYSLRGFEELDKQDGVMDWPVVGHSLKLVKLLLHGALLLVGMVHTKAGYRPALVAAFDRLQRELSDSHPDDRV